MKRLALLLVPALIYAQNLKDLLDYATNKSDLVVAKTFTKNAKAKNVEAQKSAFYPTVDVGGMYQRYDEPSPFMPGTTYGGYGQVGVDLYDGGKKSALVKQKKEEFEASSYDVSAMKKSLSLQIVQNYFTIKNLEAMLQAQQDAKVSLKAQVYRITQFYLAKVATKDDVDRLQSAYDTNIYNIESTKLDILSAKKQLELKVGETFTKLDDSSFKELALKQYEQLDDTKSLIAQKNSLTSSARALQSAYYPVLSLTDKYFVYGYEDVKNLPFTLPKSQNQLLATLNIRVFDGGMVEKSKEAILMNAEALDSQIHYQDNEQKVNYEIAQERLKTSIIEIKSAKSALTSAKSAFTTIEEKYNAGIADNVTYLDALANLTNAKALYTKALNDQQMAYATYYYYSGKNIGEFLK